MRFLANYKKIYFFFVLAFLIALAAVLFYSNTVYASIQVADNLHAIWPSSNNPALCQQTLGSGWQSLGWDGYSNIQYCAHPINFNEQTSISLVDNVQAIWPSANAGTNGGNIDCQAALGSSWQSLGYDGTSNITFCKHFSVTSTTPRNFIDNLKSVYPSTSGGANGGANDCSRALGADWQTFGYNGVANTTYCKHFVTLALSSSAPVNNTNTNPNNTNTALPNLAIQLPNGLTATAGTSFSIIATIVNNGQARTQGNSWTQTAFSGPGLPTAGQINGFGVPTLEVNSSYVQSLSFTPPQVGTYYVGVCVDVNYQVTESNESDADNCRTVAIIVNPNTTTTTNTATNSNTNNYNTNTTSNYNTTNTTNTTQTNTTSTNTNTNTNQNSTGQPPTTTTNFATNINQTSATLNGSVNPNNSATEGWFEYGTTASLGSQTGSQTMGNSSANLNLSYSVAGLQLNTTYYFRAVAQNSYGAVRGSILSFTTAIQQTTQQFGSSPIIYTNPPSGVGPTYATLQGYINPNNLYTNAWFEYGTTPSLGSSISSNSIGAGSSFVNFSQTLTGLSPNTTYYYRALAQNSNGIAYGNILNLITVNSYSYSYTSYAQGNERAPIVATRSASSIFQNVAILNGSAVPNNLLTSAWFEWGQTPALVNSTVRQTLVGNYNSLDFSNNITGLSSNTTYYYQAVAENAQGRVRGILLSFNTLSQFEYSTVVPAITYARPIVTQQKTPVETTAPKVSLILTNDKNELKAGDIINLTAVYLNGDDDPIHDLSLKISFPEEAEYLNASLLPVFISQSQIGFMVGTLGAHSQGAINSRAVIKPKAIQGNNLIWNFTLDYKDNLNNPRSINNFITIKTSPQSASGGLATMIGASGIFRSFLFWILSIIVAVVSFYLIFRATSGQREK